MSDQLFLCSGGMGGKSTFVGGLYSHVTSRDDIATTYELNAGPNGQFRRNVLERLFEQQQYPEHNPNPYILDLTLNGRPFSRSVELTVVDPPGETLEAVRQTGPPWKQQQDEEHLEREYNELVEHGEPSSGTLPPDELDTVLRHTYLQSDKVLFLLNLRKIVVGDGRELAYGVDDVREVAEEKDVAIVATATDIFDYKPDEEVVSSGILDYVRRSRAPVDTDLLGAIKDAISPGASPRTNNILSAVEVDTDIAFFGVAVPSQEPGKDERPIAAEDGTVETWGFENVVQWMS